MDGVGRLRIVCVADRASAGRALAARTRLERVARGELGAALERQVSDPRQVRLGRLTVRLTIDPQDYDDPTLAILWARGIREAIQDAVAASAAGSRAAASTTPPVPTADAAAGGGRPTITASVKALAVAARRAIAADPIGRAHLARVIMASPDEVARELGAALSVAERRALLQAFAVPAQGAGRGRRSAARPATPSPRPTPGEPVPGRGRTQPARGGSWVARLQAAVRHWQRASQAHAPPRPPLDDPAARPTQADRRPPPAREPSLVVHSRVAGLGLLWPWLTAHLEASTDRLLPRLDPADVRRLALAALVPDVPGAVDDPVLRLFAGDDLAREPSLIIVAADEIQLAADGAESVLDAFASALPGFEASTPEFLRREFLVRAGTVEWAEDPVTIRLGRLPLDPALSRLPYPISAFRLPWTRPIAIHLEPG